VASFLQVSLQDDDDDDDDDDSVLCFAFGSHSTEILVSWLCVETKSFIVVPRLPEL